VSINRRLFTIYRRRRPWRPKYAIRMSRIAARVTAVALGLVIAFFLLLPRITGPFSVDCGPVEPEDCERAVRQLGSAQGGELWPITAVWIHDYMPSDGLCGSFSIERWIFKSVSTYDCL
jgi:hypothetical protein